jgi:hypothetical protein
MRIVVSFSVKARPLAYDEGYENFLLVQALSILAL